MQKRPTVSAPFHHKEMNKNVLIGFKKNRDPNNFSFYISVEEFIEAGKFRYDFLQISQRKRKWDFFHYEEKWYQNLNNLSNF